MSKKIEIELEKLEVTKLKFEDSHWASGGSVWDASSLYHAAKLQNCEVYKLPIKFIDCTTRPFHADGIYNFVFQMRRTMNTDLNIPVLVGPLGEIMDGWHRVARAIYEGKTFVKAMKLKELPPPDRRE